MGMFTIGGSIPGAGAQQNDAPNGITFVLPNKQEVTRIGDSYVNQQGQQLSQVPPQIQQLQQQAAQEEQQRLAMVQAQAYYAAQQPQQAQQQPQGLMQAPTPAPQPQTPTAAPSVVDQAFGSGAATANRPADQLETIKGTWNQFLYGLYSADQIQGMMTQYGVNFADISAATGYPVSVIQQMLAAKSGSSLTNGTQMPSRTPNVRPDTFANHESGMVGLNTSGDNTERMQQYYDSYFKGSNPDTGMLSSWYGSDYNPRPTGFSTAAKGASSAQGLVNSLTWGTPERDTASTKTLYGYMSKYGLTVPDIAKATGFTDQQIVDHFKKYGYSVNLPTDTKSTTRQPDGFVDGQPYYDPDKGVVIGGSR